MKITLAYNFGAFSLNFEVEPLLLFENFKKSLSEDIARQLKAQQPEGNRPSLPDKPE